nr:MAG: Replication initiator protein A (RepA) N-terminus [Bacteriophage sp.]
MSKQYFNTEIAGDLGIRMAIVYQFIVDACKANATEWTQCHDGRFWVEFPQSRFMDVFPYMKPATVRSILNKLQRFRLIDSACFDTYTKVIKSYAPVPDDRFNDLA